MMDDIANASVQELTIQASRRLFNLSSNPEKRDAAEELFLFAFELGARSAKPAEAR